MIRHIYFLLNTFGHCSLHEYLTYYYWNVARYCYQEHPDEHDRQGEADGEGEHSHGVGGGAAVLGPDQAAVQDDAAVQEQGEADGGHHTHTAGCRLLKPSTAPRLLFDDFPPSFLMIFLRDELLYRDERININRFVLII